MRATVNEKIYCSIIMPYIFYISQSVPCLAVDCPGATIPKGECCPVCPAIRPLDCAVSLLMMVGSISNYFIMDHYHGSITILMTLRVSKEVIELFCEMELVYFASVLGCVVRGLSRCNGPRR